MENINIIQTIIAGALIAAAAGILGSFALLRRMALVGDALSHVALPGIALGLLFNFNLFLGSFAFLVLGVLTIWLIEHKTKLPVDTLVGVFFTLALAVGSLLAPQEHLLEALFGDITNLGKIDFWAAVVLSIVIILFLLSFSKKFALAMISPDLSRSIGLKPHQLELLFLFIFAVTVAAGIKFTGALLMGSLIIIPAAAAKNLANSMNKYILLSAVLGVIGAIGGIFASYLYNITPGPAFIIVAGLIFFLSIFFRK